MGRRGTCALAGQLDPESYMHGRTGASYILGPVALLAGIACSQQPQASAGGETRSMGSVIKPPPRDTTAPAARDTTPDQRPRLVRLDSQARPPAKTGGCPSASALPPAPLRSRW